MSDYADKYPLLALMDILREWTEGVRHVDFWQEGNNVDYVNYVEDIRQEFKELILWMELKGVKEEALRLEYEMQTFRKAVWDFKYQCKHSCNYPPEDEDCYQLRYKMAEQAEILSSCAEDLNDEIDSSIWEEYVNA